MPRIIGVFYTRLRRNIGKETLSPSGEGTAGKPSFRRRNGGIGMTSLELAKEASKFLNEKKALELKIVKIEEISSLADYFVFATGTSNTHVNALADEVEMQLKKIGIMPDHIEGYRSNSWVLLDYGTVIVHVFTPDSREFYDLDRLWQDGQLVDTSFLN